MIALPHPEILGIIFALTGALAWASHYLLIRVGLDDGELSNIVIIALSCNVFIIVPLAVVLNFPDIGASPRAIVLFAMAGLSSGLIGRVLQYKSTNTIGASRTSPITSSAGAISALLAVVVLNESLSFTHLVGILLIAVGVAAASYETSTSQSETPSFLQVGRNVSLPVLAAFFYGIEPILVKMGLSGGTPPLIGMSIMIVTAMIGFNVFQSFRGYGSVFAIQNDSELRWYITAGIAGTTAFLSYFAALNLAPVVVVMPIFQTVPLLVAVLSFIFLPRRLENVTVRLIVAATLVVVGATLVTTSI